MMTNILTHTESGYFFFFLPVDSGISVGNVVLCSSRRLDWTFWIKLKKSSSGTVGAGRGGGIALLWSSIRLPWKERVHSSQTILPFP